MKKYKKLKNVMIMEGMSKKSLSKKTNIPLSLMESKLNGYNEFTIQEAEKISKILNLNQPTQYFFEN